MSSPMTFADFLSCISSQEAASGVSQPDLPDGPTISPSGQAPARAKAKASPAKGSEPMIQGICGRTFIGSSVPDGPLSSWENRLRQRLARIGSTESALIWRTKTTPLGRSISRLAPSTLHTNGNDCIGSRWTKTARDWKDSAGWPGRIGRQAEAGSVAAADGEIFANPESERREKGGPNMSFGAGGVPFRRRCTPTPRRRPWRTCRAGGRRAAALDLRSLC